MPTVPDSLTSVIISRAKMISWLIRVADAECDATISVGGGVVGNFAGSKYSLSVHHVFIVVAWAFVETAGVAGRTCKFESREARTTPAVGVVGRGGVVRRETTNEWYMLL